jgi:outer membrane protein assembly factor BamE
MRVLLTALLLASLTACGFIGFPGVYKINVEQGNIITQEDVDKLERGMTRRQVRFLLGTPLIEDTFHQDRWDYLYEFKRGERVFAERNVTVFFDGDRLVRISGDYLPAWAKDTDESESDPDAPNVAEEDADAAAPEGSDDSAAG